jgi:hypothetical protein
MSSVHLNIAKKSPKQTRRGRWRISGKPPHCGGYFPIQFGRKTGLGSVIQMMEDYKKRSLLAKEAAKLTEEELKGRIIVGELVDIEKPEMIEEIEKMKKRASGGDA